MARDHARVLTRIWGDPEWRALTGAEQRAYLLVLSDPALNYAGVTATTVRRWAGQASDTPERALRQALRGLEAQRFLVIDWDTEELLVRSFLRNDRVLTVPNVAKAAYSAWRGVVSQRIRAAVLVELHRIVVGPSECWRQPALDAVKEWLAEPLPEGFGEGSAEGFRRGLPEGQR